jgi:hypothetical protein
MIWALTPLMAALSCLGGCAATIAETAGGKEVRGVSIEITASERMEQAAANRIDPLARELLGIGWQEAILDYYSEVSAEWTVDEAILALRTARGMALFEVIEAPDEGTSGGPTGVRYEMDPR